MARHGILSCAVGLLLLTALPHMSPQWAPRVVYAAATFLAFTSATVVSSLTALASLQCDEGVSGEGKPTTLAKGRALGEFRSAGQLGRAIGPLMGKFEYRLIQNLLTSNIACASYWTFGPSLTYSTAAVSMFALAFGMSFIAIKPKSI